MTELLTFGLLCAASWYVLARARITQALWTRYPRPIAAAARCAACSGFWIGGAWAIATGRARGPLELLELALVGLLLTPLGAALLVAALEVLAADRRRIDDDLAAR